MGNKTGGNFDDVDIVVAETDAPAPVIGEDEKM